MNEPSGMSLRKALGASGIVAAVVATSVFGLPAQAQAQAQSSSAGEAQTTTFDIKAQSLARALVLYSEQSRIVLVVPAELVDGKTAPAVQGAMAPEEALAKLLGGTGLKSSRDASGALTITSTRDGAAAPATELRSIPVVIDDDGDSTQALEVMEQITVTGSRIEGASDSGAIAVTTLSRDDLAALGENGTGDILSNLPQAGSFEINDSSDGPNDARGDVATVNLRGLGTGNTLILLNGRRITAHGINQDVGSVPRQVTNVNAFPAAAIERVEVLRDGASALYGADATAGVVNTILSPDLEQSRFTVRYDQLEGTNSDELSMDFAFGFDFNGGRTRAITVGSFYTRDGVYANELGPQFSNVDKRALLGDSPYAESSDFRNTSSNSPLGTFEVISSFDRESGIFEDVDVNLDPVRAAELGLDPDEVNLTRGGTFHIQPCDFNGRSRIAIGETVDGCMAIGERSLPTQLRYDFNGLQPLDSFGRGLEIAVDSRTARGRQLISDADRLNLYTMVEHDFDNGVQGFAEVLYYRSETEAQRAASPVSLSDGIVVPRTNFYNPFGALGTERRLDELADGDVPDEGYELLIRNWRPQAGGPRIIETKSDTFRVLGGARGDFGDWDWESALGYSENRTEDRENRMSKTLLNEALARSTPDALNPFGSNANTAEQLRAVQVTVQGEGMTSLLTADFRVSNANLFSTWAGDAGAAFGVDFRNEAYDEDRDPRIDGTLQFDGNGSGVSDIVGVSPTADSDADRNVLAAFAETLIPLVAPSGGLVSNEVNLQLAVRAEHFDDIDESVATPKIALSYFPIRGLNLRAAYSEGFRAPNLIQLNRGDTSRLDDGFVDFVRDEAIGNPEDTGNANLRSVRISNPDLKPEDTETLVFGLALDATAWFEPEWLDKLDFTLDFWRFEQTDVIDVFGVQEGLAVDFVRRLEGGSNPNVIRAPVTADDQVRFDEYNAANPNAQVPVAGQVLFVNNPFINLDRQEAEGIDIGLAARIETERAGSFNFRVDVSKLEKLDVFRSEELVDLVNDPRFAAEFSSLSVDQVEVDGNPEWRGSASLTWRKGPWSAAASARYVSGFFDTSVDDTDIDGDGEIDFFEVDSQTRFNAYVDFRARFSTVEDRTTRIRLGVNNLTDEAPPLADQSRGFYTSVHSLRGREFYLQIRTDF
ncbi:TonB-dependent receptor [Exilibacterium tricleocarpae]|uniref:TonB-dependent receptor n=1 Tax=Exilibacterium tricleocarpae TaxID=2591008 RepID=A0A545UBG8_9GAMM|nr:TonB-dependent receptor [Exilibacterium tricleocarpae]TQV86805.1 TonB-dependent receptor [Exilibacterium tricleocarpae]